MISDPRQLTALVDDLAAGTWTLAAIGTLFESGLAEALREPRTLDELADRVAALTRERIARCLAVVELHGIVGRDGDRYRLAPGAEVYAQAQQRTDLLGEIRSSMMQALAYVDAAGGNHPTRGWHHTDPRLLQAQGDSSVGFASAIKAKLGAVLDGLDVRLAQPGARFLDVGVGVAALSIAMCREFPQLQVVGLDVFDVPLALARDNLRRAELADRVELRQLAIEDLRDEQAFDLVWLPAFFLAASGVPAAFARARAALRPGGWLLVPTLAEGVEDARRRIVGLVSEQWGCVPEAAAMAGVAREAGFAEVRTLPGPGWVALIAARG